MKKKLPRGICKYIRLEKARIHRGVLDVKKQKELIDELYQKIIRTSPSARTLKAPPTQRTSPSARTLKAPPTQRTSPSARTLKAEAYSKQNENTRNLQPSDK